MIKVFREVFSPIEVNCYIITGDGEKCIVIDCGCYDADEEKRLADLLEEKGLTPVMLIDTHCHLDHVFGNGFMLRRYGLRPWFHKGDSDNYRNAPAHAMMYGLTMESQPEPEGYLTDGEIVKAAGVSLRVIAVPGHSPGGIALYSRDGGILFTGDALFAGSIGRSDLPGGNHKELLKSIREKLFVLPADTVVYPGHGPLTTVRLEIEQNPYFNL